MNDRVPSAACTAIRPLLFAASEGEIDRPARLAVHAHLAVCDACRSWQRAERALTALLVDTAGVTDNASPPNQAPRPVRSRLLAAASAFLLASLVLLVLPAAKPRGLLVQRQLGPDQGWQLASERHLLGEDVIEVPAAAAVTLRLGKRVQIDAVGPARFALDTVDGVWQVTVDRGTAVASIEAGGALLVGPDGEQRVGAGQWLLVRDRVTRQAAGQAPAQDLPTQDPVRRSAAELLADGMQRFGSSPFTDAQDAKGQLAAAERLLRAALVAKDATPDHQRRATFYLLCSVSRLGRKAEAFELERQYLERFPNGAEASLVRFYMAAHLRDVGRVDEAKAQFERVLRDEGESSLGNSARSYLKVMGVSAGRRVVKPAPAAPAPPPAGRRGSTRRLPWMVGGETAGGGYLVVPVDIHGDDEANVGFVAAAGAAQRFHKGNIYWWNGSNFEALERELRQQAPANVLFVLRPETLDLVLHRRLLLLSARIDADWFCDYSFGYLTAEDGAACQRLWQRIEAVHERGTLQGLWWQASVATLDKSLLYDKGASPHLKAAGFEGPHYYYGSGDADRETMVARSLRSMAKAAVVEFTGCGDPQGIWLFPDKRNLQRELHWDYEPGRVGEDPDGAMPRLLAERFRKLQLDAPILWSGTCHSGAVCRVFVEGDIVSTFGRTEHATVHRLKPEDSLALSWLEAGAASMLVPLGANHGMSVSMEVDFALRHGASLGETIKSTYDDVLLAAEGKLVLDLPVAGEPHRRGGEYVMQGGGANRILIGDPLLRPFRKTPNPAEHVGVARTATGLTVTVTRADGWQPRSWDMFGNAGQMGHRVLVRVDLTALGLGDRQRCTASVSGTAKDGVALPFVMRRQALEHRAGRTYLHLQANGPRKQLDRKAATVVFKVTVRD